jgi:Ser/Thr protein kinase RdoA (MazF antagonist)
MTRPASRSNAEDRAGGAADAEAAPAIFGVGSMARGGAAISPTEAERLAREHWGIGGTAAPMSGEVDQNFRIESPSGPCLLKVVPSDEDTSLTDLVTAALLHLERSDDVRVQRVMPTGTGAALASFRDADGVERRARMTTFLAGRTLRSVPLDADLRRRVGATVARLARGLRDFEHPGADRDLSWDLRHAGRMRAMLDELGPGGDREALAECLAAFDARTVPRLVPLPSQILHNDLSRDNAVLTEDGEVGVLDFGDTVRTQRVCDLAVAMADQLDAGPEPFAPALDVAAGYSAVSPLAADEAALLYDLVRTRVATRIVGGEWRSARFPENRAYLTRNVEPLRGIFARLPEAPLDADARRLEELGGGRR